MPFQKGTKAITGLSRLKIYQFPLYVYILNHANVNIFKQIGHGHEKTDKELRYTKIYSMVSNVSVSGQRRFWPRGYKILFMLNSAEHEICPC